MYVGREDELGRLEGTYGKGKAILVYGRRRIGISSLMERFSEGKRVLNITCVDSTLRINLDIMSRSVGTFLGEECGRYRDCMEMIDALSRVCAEGHNVIVIHDYHHLRRSCDEIDSLMQRFIDLSLSKSRSTLVLCCKEVAATSTLGLDGKEPLYGRFRHIIHLDELDLEEIRGFHPGMSDHDVLMLYLLFGGIPRYHLGRGDSFHGYLSGCIADGWIEDEADLFLRSDTHSFNDSFAVLMAIACGNTSPKTIQDTSGLGTKYVTVVKELQAMGIIGSVKPMVGAPKRLVYHIIDPLLSFCFRFMVDGSDVLSDDGCSHLVQHLIERFKLFCRREIERRYPVLEIGSWWMDDHRNDLHDVIDIVARVPVGRFRVDLFANCHLSPQPVGFPQYWILENSVSRFVDRSNPCLMLISESGFEEGFREFAESTGVMLVGPEHLHGHQPFPEIPLEVVPTSSGI